MKIRYPVYILLVSLAFASCGKNNVSNIPQISLMYFGTRTSTDSFIYKADTPFLQFSLADGDADLGNGQPGPPYDIYIKDFRFDTGYVGYFFPTIDKSIENAKKGIQGMCTFLFTEYILTPRPDSIHVATGDTTHFELYMVDRAGHHSNHITTRNIIMRP